MINGMNGSTHERTADPAPEQSQAAPVLVVKFGLGWRQIIAGGTVLSGLIGSAGVAGWLVMPSDMRNVEERVTRLETAVAKVGTAVKDFDDTQSQVIDVLLEVRGQVARLAAGAPAAVPAPPPDLMPALPRRRQRRGGPLIERSTHDLGEFNAAKPSVE